MFTRFKIAAVFLAVLLQALPIQQLHSQRIVTVNVNTQLTGPPYSVPFEEIKEKLRITLLSNAGMEGVYLTMTISGDNGVLIQSNGNQIFRFYIPSAVPLVIPGPEVDIDYLFRQENLNFTNINPDDLYNYGLPAGNYQICFRVWSSGMAGDVPVSSAPPSGCFNFSIQQPVVNISTIVRPPWDANFLEYYQKTTVILNSTQFSSFFLRMHLKGDNGIDIKTPASYFPSSMIPIEPNVPLTLSEEDLWHLFNPDRLDYSGITATELQDKGLPAGTYTLCFRAYSRNGEALTAPDPAGCSSPFTLRSLDPPIILTPQCGKVIDAEMQAPILFSWTPSPGAPPLTPYTLRIVEIDDPNAPPGEALQTATTPAFFEETVATTSFLYGPAQPELEKGKRYAFQVIAGTEALDIENPFDFNSGRLRFKNNGMSEPCYFTYGSFITVQPLLSFKPPVPEVTQITPDPEILPYTIVRGQLNYKFKNSGTTISDNNQMINIPVGGNNQTANSSGNDQGIPAGNKSTTSGISGISSGQSSAGFGLVNTTPTPDAQPLLSGLGYIDPAGSEPLANIPVSLEVRYVLLSGKINNADVTGKLVDPSMFISEIEYKENFPDDGKILQTTQTAADGSFNFLFVNTDTAFGEKQDLELYSSVEIGDNAKAEFIKTVRLIVNNKYYCSPDVNISIKPWKENDYGTLVSYVKSYNLLLHVKSTTATFYDQKSGSGAPLNDVHARILRAEGIPGVPYNEGEISSKILPFFGTKKQVADGYTDMDGNVIISGLVMHDPDNNSDRYYIECKTSETSGNINYKDFEKRYSPIYLKDKKNFPFNSIGKELVTLEPGPDIIMPSYYEQFGLGITFNSEFNVQTFEYTAEMYPELPRVYGQAFVSGMKDLVNWGNTMSDTIKPGVKVLLFSEYEKAERVPESENISGTLSIKNTYTDANGRYSFEKLPLELDMSGWKPGDPATYKAKVTGPKRWLITKPKGFGLIEKDLHIPKYGDQIEANLILNPDGIALGYVVDENNQPVRSGVKIESYPVVKTGKAGLGTILALAGSKVKGLDQLPQNAEMFAFLAPSSESSGLKIIPDNLSLYAPLDTTIQIYQSDDENPGTIKKFVVKKLMHRVKFRIMAHSGPPGSLQLAPTPLEGVKIKVKNIIGNVEGVSDENGYVSLQFLHSESVFRLDVIPPENSDYSVTETGFVSNPGTETVFKKNISLFPAYKVKGKVTIGDNSEPADSVRVYVDGSPAISTYTKTDGSYQLRKIPAEFKTCVIKAEKYDPELTIISDATGELKLPFNGSANLHLEIEPEMPSEFFGFPVVIDSVNKQGNIAVVSGNITDPSKLSSGNFKLMSPDQVQLDFTNVRLIKTPGENIFRPEESKIQLDADKLELMVNNAFIAEHFPAAGSLISIEEGGNKRGIMNGKVKLKNSFGFNASLFSFKNGGAWLAETGQDNEVIRVFHPPSLAVMRPGKLELSGENNSDLPLILKSFEGVAIRNGSYLSRDTLILSLSLQTKEIANINPSVIKIDIGKFGITNSGFETVSGTEQLSFNLENWKILAGNWKLSQESKGFEISSGTLKTGIVDLPVNKLELTPNNFQIHQVLLKDMSLSGVIPVNIETDNTSFGYFPSVGKDQKGHWRLSATGLSGEPAASISGLPGLKPSAKLSFSTFSLLSNGEQSLDFIQTGEELEFYNTLSMKPIAIYPYDGYFLLDGAMDPGIPRIEKQNGTIRYSKQGSNVKFDLFPLNMDFEGPGKVRFYGSQVFGEQKFDNGNFLVPGELRDEEGIKLKAVLHREMNNIWLEVDPYNQIIPIGSNGTTRLIDIRGEMRVDPSANDWELFSFEGIMDGLKGMEGDKKKKFTIYGDIVAGNQDVKVKNIESGFGNLNITFDYKNARMIGDMDINQNFAGMSMHGMANMMVDGNGWYFLAGGQVETPGLGDFQAGFMIGDYSLMPADVSSRLMQFAYDKKVPASFSNSISGMFITGRKGLPLIDIPDVSIDLWILSAKLGVDAGLDARIWMGFDGTGNEYGIGAMAFAHAYFIASSITCTSLSADARAEMGAKGLYQTSTGTFSVNGCGSFSLAARIEQCFPTVVAGCEGCTGKTLYESIKMNMLLDSQGNTNLSFDFGNCSGQNSMTSGW